MGPSDVIEILNPAHAAADEASDVTIRFQRRGRGQSLRVAYIDNVKPNTAELFDLTNQRLGNSFNIDSKFYTKDYGAGPARPGTYEEIARSADLAVVGVAD